MNERRTEEGVQQCGREPTTFGCHRTRALAWDSTTLNREQPPRIDHSVVGEDFARVRGA